jgi:hypothetical protein
MLKKHVILLGIIISLLFLIIATRYYPGGSQYDKNAIGYSWKNNYLSNLFSPKAVNGSANASRFWAVPGMLSLCLSFALFFFEFSKKIPVKGAANIVRYFGTSAMLFAFLVVTPYHDQMVTITSTLALVSMFYITVFIFRSQLLLFKITSIVCLLALYICNYVYYTRNYLEFLPVFQKVALAITITWMLTLQYFTTSADFDREKNVVAERNNR